MSELVLTYGAGGVQGAPVARNLLQQGYRVRALVKNLDKNQALKQAGAELVQGNLADLESVQQATVGVDKVFLMLPSTAGGNPLDYAQNAVQAALENGVKLLVFNTSGLTPEKETGAPMMDFRIYVERMLRESGMPNVILRPTSYMENFLAPWIVQRLQQEDVIAFPTGETRPTSWIAAEDLGRLAVAALGHPELAGQAYNVGGPEALTGADIARSFSAGLGRAVRFETVSPEAFGKIMASMMGPEVEAAFTAGARAGEDAPMNAHVVDMQPVLKVLPIEQTTLESWVRTNAALFETSVIH